MIVIAYRFVNNIISKIKDLLDDLIPFQLLPYKGILCTIIEIYTLLIIAYTFCLHFPHK